MGRKTNCDKSGSGPNNTGLIDGIYKDLVNHSLQAIAVSQGLRFVFVNNTFSELSGYSTAELLNMTPDTFQSLIYADDRQRVFDIAQKRLKGESVPEKFEFRFVRKDGTIGWAEQYAKLIEYNGRPATAIAYVDITERKIAEKKLSGSERRFRGVFENAVDGMLLLSADGTIKDCNATFCGILRYPSPAINGRKPWEVSPPVQPDGMDSNEKAMKLVRSAFDGQPQLFEWVHTKADGTPVYVEVHLSTMDIDGDKMILAIVRDIMARKKMENALKESEEKYRSLVENANEAVVVAQDGILKYANPKTLQLTGMAYDDLVGMPFEQLIHPEDRRLVLDRHNQRLGGASPPESYEFRVFHKDGSPRWAELNTTLILWENMPATLNLITEVTARKKMEEAVSESEAKFRNLFMVGPDAFYIATMSDGKIVEINQGFEQVTGYSRDEALGKTSAELNLWYDYSVRSQMLAGLKKEGQARVETLMRVKSGKIRNVLLSTRSFTHSGETSIVGCIIDITEQKKLEEKLILTDRLASIGMLVSGVAHELNNPLTSIIGFSDLILEEELSARVKESVDIISKEARRSADIVKGLLTFARKQGAAKMAIDLADVIRDVLQLRVYEQRLNNIEVTTDYEADLPKVQASYSQLEQVFINIVVNAEQAMAQTVAKRAIRIRVTRNGDFVRVSFSDTGPGIKPEHIRQIFTPFFTTKEPGKGTGLGLSISHGIITEHGGKISADSTPGQGATFIVELPVAQT